MGSETGMVLPKIFTYYALYAVSLPSLTTFLTIIFEYFNQRILY